MHTLGRNSKFASEAEVDRKRALGASGGDGDAFFPILVCLPHRTDGTKRTSLANFLCKRRGSCSSLRGQDGLGGGRPQEAFLRVVFSESAHVPKTVRLS